MVDIPTPQPGYLPGGSREVASIDREHQIGSLVSVEQAQGPPDGRCQGSVFPCLCACNFRKTSLGAPATRQAWRPCAWEFKAKPWAKRPSRPSDRPPLAGWFNFQGPMRVFLGGRLRRIQRWSLRCTHTQASALQDCGHSHKRISQRSMLNQTSRAGAAA